MNIQDLCRSHVELVYLLRDEFQAVLENAAVEITQCLSEKGTVFACGNGGSASQAEHFAGELMGRFNMDRRALPVFALSQNSAVLTAIANDISYANVFSRQLEGLGKSGDCLVALSTSGGSENIINACVTARNKGMRIISLTGMKDSPVARASDVAIEIPGSDSAEIQEIHIIILHIICRVVEERLFA